MTKPPIRDRSQLENASKKFDWVAPEEIDEALCAEVERSFSTTPEEWVEKWHGESPERSLDSDRRKNPFGNEYTPHFIMRGGTAGTRGSYPPKSTTQPVTTTTQKPLMRYAAMSNAGALELRDDEE
jgi:hypothetical protein